MGKVNDICVPSVGSTDAKIMIVGEAPGKDEEAEGEPFVGKAGQFQARYLERIGITRRDVYYTNLSKFRPSANRFENLLGTEELTRGLEELDSEIGWVNPNIIVAFGRWPMYYLTGCTAMKGKPGTGIMSWRGSVVPGVEDHVPSAKDHKVLIAAHPSFVMRPEGFWSHPLFFNDLKRIPIEMHSPELKYPHYEEYIDPPNLEELAHKMMRSEWLTVDIETFGESLACVGFADSTKRGLCITFENPLGWDIAREMLASQQKKIFQYGNFDINYLAWFYGWDVNGYLSDEIHPGGFDTYIAAANLMSEFPRGLGFLNSMYTPFPYYKEDGKKHKQTGDLTTLWRYNIKDVISTHWIAMEQMEELGGLYS